jgi:hypothetical protein
MIGILWIQPHYIFIQAQITFSASGEQEITIPPSSRCKRVFQNIYHDRCSEAISQHDFTNPSNRKHHLPSLCERIFQNDYPGRCSEAISQHDFTNPSSREHLQSSLCERIFQNIYPNRYTEAISQHDITNLSVSYREACVSLCESPPCQSVYQIVYSIPISIQKEP